MPTPERGKAKTAATIMGLAVPAVIKISRLTSRGSVWCHIRFLTKPRPGQRVTITIEPKDLPGTADPILTLTSPPGGALVVNSGNERWMQFKITLQASALPSAGKYVRFIAHLDRPSGAADQAQSSVVEIIVV